MMKRKMKKYSGEDGESEVIDMRDNEKNDVGDDVRARAMKFLQTGKKEEEAPSSKPRASVKKVTKTVVENSKEPKNFKVPEEKGLETVSPELDLLPIGKVAGVLGAGYLGARALGKRILGKRASEVAEKMAEKLARTRSSGAMKDDFKPSEIREGFKRGGTVKKSSASSRGDGIAVKGYTRGKIC